MSKIRKISFINHPILKNLELDFRDANGNAVDTIIFAGENGTGKSTILNSLYALITGNPNFEAVIEVEYPNSVEIFTYFNNSSHSSISPYLVRDTSGKQYHPRGDDFHKISHFSAVFSDVDINFHATDISSVTSMTLDGDAQSRKSDTNFPKHIKQLLIDIQAMDDADSARICRANPTKSFSNWTSHSAWIASPALLPRSLTNYSIHASKTDKGKSASSLPRMGKTLPLMN